MGMNVYLLEDDVTTDGDWKLLLLLLLEELERFCSIVDWLLLFVEENEVKLKENEIITCKSRR